MVAGLEGDAASIGLWEIDGDIVLTGPKHCFQNWTGPGGRTVKTGNRDENRFFKPKEPDFLLIS